MLRTALCCCTDSGPKLSPAIGAQFDFRFGIGLTKLESLQATVTPHFAHYNVVLVHETLRVMLTMAANVTDRLSSLEEMADRTPN